MPGADFLEAIILGVVQGITEFLPVSSSGHLVILQELLGRWSGTSLSDSGKMQLNIALHFGTLLSILVVYRADLLGLLHKPRLCLAIILASIPAGLAGVYLKDWFETVFASPLIAGCCLLVTAALLALAQRVARDEKPLDDISKSDALLIGTFQAMALMPGISRSGSTIAAGLLCGLRREVAVTFSFLMAVPVLGGAALLEFKDVWAGEGGHHSLPVLGAGAAVAFVVGIGALHLLIRLVSQRKLHWFAWYCALAGGATIVWQLAF